MQLLTVLRILYLTSFAFCIAEGAALSGRSSLEVKEKPTMRTSTAWDGSWSTPSGLAAHQVDSVIFTKRGRTSITQAYSNVNIVIDVAHMLAAAKDFVNLDLSQISYARHSPSTAKALSLVTQEVIPPRQNQTREYIKSITNSLVLLGINTPIMTEVERIRKERGGVLNYKHFLEGHRAMTPNPRSKRAFMALALAGVAVFTVANAALGITNRFSIDANARMIDNNSRDIADTMVQVNALDSQIRDATVQMERLSDAIQEVERNGAADAVTSTFVQSVDAFASIIKDTTNLLLQGRINSELVNKKEVEERLGDLTTERITGEIYRPVVTTVEQFAQLPVYSFADQGSLVITVSVPMTLDTFTMDVYEVTHLPTKTKGDRFHLELDNDIRYLAVSKGTQNLYQGMSEEQFQACRTIGQDIICDKQLATNKKDLLHNDDLDEEKCVYAFFMETPDIAKKVCTFRRAKTVNKIKKLSGKAIVANFGKPSLVTIKCRQETQRLVDAVGPIYLEVNPGCSIDMAGKHVAADAEILKTEVMEADLQFKSFGTPNVVSELFDVDEEILMAGIARKTSIHEAMEMHRTGVTLIPWRHRPTSTFDVLTILLVAFVVPLVISCVFLGLRLRAQSKQVATFMEKLENLQRDVVSQKIKQDDAEAAEAAEQAANNGKNNRKRNNSGKKCNVLR